MIVQVVIMFKKKEFRWKYKK